jgi:hypothetical protein
MHPQNSVQYGQPHHNGHNGYYQPQQQPSYGGPVYYPVNHGGGDMGQHATYDNRKRPFEALNDFFGDIKQKQVDQYSYAQASQRLIPLHGLPIQNGAIDVGYAHAQPMVAVGGPGHAVASMLQPHYALPIPNLRTKTDLLNIDHFLEQMQSTVYESSNAAAAAGVHQAGGHYTHRSVNFRQSQSPPQTANNNLGGSSVATQTSGPAQTAPMMAPTASHSPQSSTPALTPPSGSLSYTSGHSPSSVPGLSPSTSSRQTSSTSAGYPTLPAVTSAYAPQSNASPVSTLGTNFDNDPRKRFGGGMLQKSSGHRSQDYPEHSESPVSKYKPSPLSKADPNIDPALSGVSTVSSPTSHQSEYEDVDRAEEIWLQNVRVVEAVRLYIQGRLERHEYDDDDETPEGEGKGQEAEHQSLYPVLRAAIDAE